jgi:hypothetical protein
MTVDQTQCGTTTVLGGPMARPAAWTRSGSSDAGAAVGLGPAYDVRDVRVQMRSGSRTRKPACCAVSRLVPFS